MLYVVVLEGKYTTEMQLKHTDSSLKVILEVKKQIDEVSENLLEEERERLNEYKSAPLLTGKVNCLIDKYGKLGSIHYL